MSEANGMIGITWMLFAVGPLFGPFAAPVLGLAAIGVLAF